MWTISYRGAYVHGYCDKAECRVQFADFTFKRAPSLRAAKVLIRKVDG